jgi:4-amino-4-deoxy-L-arabinose transferase and related glycosyltransferases of PMT family
MGEAPLSRAVLVLLAFLLAFRLAFAAYSGLVQDEAYYWQWSRSLDLGFYDAGPGIALTIRAGTLLFGDTPLGVRFVPVLMGVASVWLAYLTARRWLGEAAAVWTAVLTATAPLLSVGSILATYDAPQMFFWTAALYALTRTLQEEQRVAGWYAVGALVGLGMLSKPTMVLFAPGVLVLLLLSPTYRRWLATPHPYLAFAVAILVFSPVIVWNLQHENLNFIHTLGRGNRTGDGSPKPLRWLGDFLGGQLLAVGVVVFLAELYALGRLFRPRSDADRFLLAFTAPTFLLCLAIALRSKLEINWPVAMHVTGLMAVGALFAGAWERGGWRRPALGALLALSGVMIAIGLFPQIVPAVAGPTPARPNMEKPLEPYGWDELAGGVERARRDLERESEGTPVFVASFTYRTASILAFYLPDKPRVEKLQLPGTRRDQYYVWARPEALAGQNAVVAVDTDVEKSAAFLRECFAEVRELPVLTLRRDGFTGKVKEWHVYACRDFRGYPEESPAP